MVGYSNESRVDLASRPRLESTQRQIHAARRVLHLLVLRRFVSIVRVVEDCNTGKCRNELLEHLQPLARQFGRNAGQSGRLATGTRDADDQTVERIAGGNDDGNGGTCFLGRL